MPYVNVPKDLSKVKTKVALNLTKRQLVCFGGGALVGIPAYLFTRGSIGNDLAAVLMIGLMLPFFAFGIYERDGQPLEKVLMNYINVMFRRPGVRPYRTENGYAAAAYQAGIDGEAETVGRGEADGRGRPGTRMESEVETVEHGKIDAKG